MFFLMYLKLRMCVPVHMPDIYTCITYIYVYEYMYTYSNISGIWIYNTVVDLPWPSLGRLSGEQLCISLPVRYIIGLIGWRYLGSELFGVAIWSFGHDVGIPDYDVNVFTIQSLIITVRCIYSRFRMYVLTYDVNVLWCQEIVWMTGQGKREGRANRVERGGC